MKLILTGARGYLGACVAEAAQARGFEPITVAQRLESLSPGSLDCELLIHCAGALREHVGAHHLSNVLAAQALLGALKRPTRILWISSRAVYAPGPGPLSEASPLAPADSYGESKLAGERLLMASEHPYTILRPTLLIGAGVGQVGSTFASQAFARMARGEPVTLFEPAPEHNWLAVRDLAAWMLDLVAADCFERGVYNASGPHRSLAATFAAYAEVLGPRLGRKPVIQREPTAYPSVPLLDSTALQALLPRRLGTDLEIAQGLAQLWQQTGAAAFP